MPGTTTSELDLGFGQSAHITTEVEGEGNSLVTQVTTNVGGLGRKMRVELVNDNLVIRTEGEWESASMATLLRGLADSLDGRS
jgi:hypothetical protein